MSNGSRDTRAATSIPSIASATRLAFLPFSFRLGSSSSASSIIGCGFTRWRCSCSDGSSSSSATPLKASRPNSSATGDSCSSASAGGGPRSTAKPDRCESNLGGGGHSCPPTACSIRNPGCPISRVVCEKWGFGRRDITHSPLAPRRDSVLCFPHPRVLDHGKPMQRLTARFLLLFAIVGTFVPLALAAAATPSHACCIRKAPHQCHGSGSDVNERAIRTTGCCNHDCCRAVTTSRSANPQSSLSPFISQNIDARVVELPVNIRPTERSSSQSTRAPPQVSIF
jgi:hypothetical protein